MELTTDQEYILFGIIYIGVNIAAVISVFALIIYTINLYVFLGM